MHLGWPVGSGMRYLEFFIRLRRRPRALPVDECGLCGLVIPVPPG
jgi:hypothetical protein